MAEIKPVRYDPHGERPHFSIRGWDDERVFVEVGCACGHDFWSDDLALNDEGGKLHLACTRCGRQYRITVLGAMVEPEGER